MISKEFITKAKNAINKLNSENYTLHTAGLFLIGDKIKYLSPHSKQFDKQVNDFPQTFVGVYNGKITVNRLAADIQHVSDLLKKLIKNNEKPNV
jgi:hypothetical protein